MIKITMYAGILLAIFLNSTIYALTMGNKAPEINAAVWTNIEAGDNPSLSEWRNRIVVLFFWGTWDKYTPSAIPTVHSWMEKYGDRHFSVVGLTSETDVDKVKGFIKINNMKFPIGIGSSSCKAYGITGYPHAVVVNPKGVIMWDGHPEADSLIEILKDAVDKADAEAPPAVHTSKNEFIGMLKEAGSNAKSMCTDDEKAMAFLDSCRRPLRMYCLERSVSKALLKPLSILLTRHQNDDVRIESVRLIGYLKNNTTAESFLSSTLRNLLIVDKLANRGLTMAVIDTLPQCGPFSARVPTALAEAFSDKRETDEQIKEAALRSLGKIRSTASIEQLINILAKIATKPEDPNPYVDWSLPKQGQWRRLCKTFYTSLNELTGEKQIGGGYTGNYWKVSDWKKWLKKNKSFCARKFAVEQKKYSEELKANTKGAIEKSEKAAKAAVVPVVPKKSSDADSF